MKCPQCWAEKAYARKVRGWRGVVLAMLLIRPMKCHHCYYKFYRLWPLTIGRRASPPRLRIAPGSRPTRRSYAASHYAAQQQRTAAPSASREPPQRADAA